MILLGWENDDFENFNFWILISGFVYLNLGLCSSILIHVIFYFYFCFFLFFYLVKFNKLFFLNLNADLAFFNDQIKFLIIILIISFAT